MPIIEDEHRELDVMGQVKKDKAGAVGCDVGLTKGSEESGDDRYIFVGGVGGEDNDRGGERKRVLWTSSAPACKARQGTLSIPFPIQHTPKSGHLSSNTWLS